MSKSSGGDNRCSDTEAVASLLYYQLSVLKAEFDYRTDPKKRRRRPLRAFLQLHTKQFCWTMKRLIIRRLFKSGSQGALQQTIKFKAASADRWLAGRLMVDVSSTFSSNAQTGIQRVVKQFADAAADMGVGCPVLIRGGELLHADESAAKLQPVEVQAGDVLFLLDANWQRPEATRLAVKSVKKAGGYVVAGLHDLIPIEFPFTCNQETIRDFVAWLDMALHTCDAFLCVSETTARSLARNASIFLDGHPAPPIGWFSLGASLLKVTASVPGRHSNTHRPYVLMVGTVEPRKGHPVGLDAMEMLWRQGVDLNLVIIGRPGWNMRFFEERLRTHPEADRRLTWMDDASDDDLVQAYERATALIYPSIAEGYGLPIIEAASFGTRVIVSDLDIFREISPPGTIFFKPCCPVDLGRAIRKRLDEARSQAPSWIAPTWMQSVEGAFGIIQKRAYQIPSAVSPPL